MRTLAMRFQALVVSLVVVGGLAAPAAAQRRSETPGGRPTRPGTQTPPGAETPTRSPGTRSPGPAPSLDQVKARCQEAVDRRAAVLKTMRSKLDPAKGLTEADRSALLSQVGAQTDDLTKLKDKIAGDTDLASVRQDCKAIVLKFRTYVLMEPKARLLAAAARVGTVVGKLRGLVDKLQRRIDEARKAGKDVAGIQAALDGAKAKMEAAAAAAKDVPATVVSLTPEGYPGNRSALLSARQALKTARDNLIAAVKALKTAASELKALEAAGR